MAELSFGPQDVIASGSKEEKKEAPKDTKENQDSQKPGGLSFGPEDVETSDRGVTGTGELGLPLSPERETAAQEQGEFFKGVSRGLRQTGALVDYAGAELADVGAGAAGALGFETAEEGLQSLSDNQIEEAKYWMEEAKKYSPEVGKVEEISSPGEALAWSSGVLGENIPTLVGAIFSGGAGSVGAKIAAKKGLKKKLRDEATDQLQEISKESVEKAGRRGGTAGVGAFTGTLGTGEVKQEVEETGEEAPGAALAGGLAMGALDTVPFVAAARRMGLGKAAKTSLSKSLDEMPKGRRALAMSGLIGGAEAGTEAAQEAIAISVGDLVEKGEIDPTGEDASRLLNAAAAGGTVGVPAGAVAGLAGPGEAAQQGQGAVPETQPESGAQAPQQAPANAPKLPAPEAIVPEAPPGSFEPATGKQLRLFPDLPSRQGFRESPPPRADESEIPSGPNDNQLDFGEFLTPFRTRPKPRSQILSFEGGQAKEVDTQSLMQDLESKALQREDQNLEPADILKVAEEVQGEPPVDPEIEIQGSEPPEGPSRILQNTRVVGQARKHGRNLQDLKDEHGRLVQDQRNYKQDGTLRADAKKKLSTIERGAAKTSKKEGIPNPIEPQVEVEDVGEQIEESGDRGVETEVIDQTEETAPEQVEAPEQEVPEPSRPQPSVKEENGGITPSKENQQKIREIIGTIESQEDIASLNRDYGVNLPASSIDQAQMGAGLELENLDLGTLDKIYRERVKNYQPEAQTRRTPSRQEEEARRRVRGRQQQQKSEEEIQAEFDQEIEQEFQDLPDFDLDSLPDVDDYFQEQRLGRNDLDPETKQRRQKLVSKEHKENVRQAIQKEMDKLGDLGIDVYVGNVTDFANDFGIRDPRTATAAKKSNSGAFYDQNGVDTGRPTAYFVPAKFPLLPSSLEAKAQRAVAHEALVHGGLDAFLTESEQQELFNLVNKKASDQEAWQDIQARYEGQGEAVQAEEYIARVAETGADIPLMRRVIAKVKRAMRRVLGNNAPFLKEVTNDEIRLMLSDIRRGALEEGSNRVREGLKPYIGASGKSYNEKFSANVDNLFESVRADTETAQNVGESIDSHAKAWQTKLANFFLTPLQLAQQYGVQPMVRYYTETVPRWWKIKSEVLDKAENHITEIQKLGKTDIESLSRMIFRATLESDQAGRKLSMEELLELWKKPDNIVQKKPIEPTQEMLDIYGKVMQSIQDLTIRMERSTKFNVARELTDSEESANTVVELWEKFKNNQEAFERQVEQRVPELQDQPDATLRLQELLGEKETDFSKLRNRNYFPLMRFGRYTVSVTASQDGVKYNGETFNEGDPIIFESFEGPGPQKNRAEELNKEFQGVSGAAVHAGKMSDEEFSFMGLPPNLMDTIKGTISLSEAQQKQLQDLFLKMSPGKSFLKHQLQRKGTQGFSTDLLRVYSSYMSNAAGHMARIETYQDMQQDLKDIDDLSKNLRTENRPTDSTTIDILSEGMKNHYDWIMNPKSEFAGLRNAGFQWYLGFNPRSALVNLTQTPMATYPYLAERYGDKNSVKKLTDAMKIARHSPRGEVNDPQVQKILRKYEKKYGKGHGDNIFEMLKQGVREGWVDESLATETAGYAEGSALLRAMPSDDLTGLMNKFSYYSGWMFSHAEQYNRRLTSIAAYNLEIENGGSHESGVQAAREAVQASQFEYAKWNRPQFMRGKQSVFFLFWQYMQHAGYLAAGGHGKGTAIRFWLMAGMMGGLQGLPFSEPIFELFNLFGTEIKEATGMEDPRVNIQEDIRKIAEGIDADPGIVMHGLSRYYGLGPLHLLSAFQAPVPNVDISASVSMGDFPPGLTTAIKSFQTGSVGAGGSTVSEEMAGPVVGVPIAVWKTLMEDNPDEWKNWERPMPTVMRNASRAIRYGVRGEETSDSGAEVVEFDPFNATHRMETIAQALGFPPSRKNVEMEEKFAKLEAKQYYLTRRTMLLQDFDYAKRTGDREALSNVRADIRRFNRSLPSPALRITSDNLSQSAERRQKRRQKEEAGLPVEKMARPLYRDIGDLYGG